MHQALSIRIFRLVLLKGIFTVASVGVVISCSQPSRPMEGEPHLAAVVSVLVPEAVEIGERFQVSILTGAPSGCWSKGYDEVKITDEGVLIVPYDLVITGAGQCADIYLEFTHHVPLRLFMSGTIDISIQHYLRSATGADSIGTIKEKVIVW